MVELRLPIEAKAAPRPQFSKRYGRAYNNPRYEVFKRKLADLIVLNGELDKPIEGPVTVTIELAFKRPKKPARSYPSKPGDVDNLAKGVMDACNKLVWVDDVQVVELHVNKVYSQDDNYIYLKVEETE
tara:strand:- start:637 stop:1020 length:384 start_codon:yes stop_codon:yes gene_type:complete